MSPDAGLILPMVKMIAALCLVLGSILIALRVLRRWTGQGNGRGGAAAIEVLATRSFGPRKAVSLVRIPGAVLVLGLGADGISTLDKITDPDLIASLDPAAPRDFTSQFLKLKS